MLHFNFNNVFEKKKGNMLLFNHYNMFFSPLIELLASLQAFSHTLLTYRHLWDSQLFYVFCLFQAAVEKLTWKDRLAGYCINVSSILFMVGKQ